MRIETINGLKIELYESPQELNMHRGFLLDHFILLDSGIGSNINDVASKLGTIAKMISADPSRAKMELGNLQTAIYYVVNHISPKFLAFTAFVKSINGENVTIKNEDDAMRVSKQLNAINRAWIFDQVDRLKKKWMAN